MEDRVKKFFIDAIKQSNNFEDAVLICDFFTKIVNLSYLRIYDFEEIEKLIYEKFVNKLNFEKENSIEFKRKECIHVVTDTYKTGGHTRLMERLAGMHLDKPTLLVTRECFCNVDSFFSEVKIIKSVSAVERFKEIFEILCEFEKIILHIHPEDILTVLVVRYIKASGCKSKIYFVNHADHQFSFGRGVSDLVLEVSCFGYFLKKKIGEGSYESSFLGIPLSGDFSEVNIENIFPFVNDVVSAGSAWKYKPINIFSFQKKIKEILLKNKKIKFHIIGVNPFFNYWWWPLKIRFPKRLNLIKSMPYAVYIDFLKNKKIFIDSYPITGGTAFAEAFMNGCLPIGFQTIVMGFTPLDKIRISTSEEFLKIIDDPNLYLKKVLELKTDLVDWHSYDRVKYRYLSALDGNYIFPPQGLDEKKLDEYPSVLEENKLIEFFVVKKYFYSKWFYKFFVYFYKNISPSCYLRVLKRILLK